MKYTINEVARKMNISAHTLRFYDDKGLFPFVERDENNVRLFSQKDLEWVYVVQCLKNTGLPLKEIKNYVEMCLEGDATISERKRLMLAQREVMKQKLIETQKMLAMLDWKVDYYESVENNRQPDLQNPFEFSQPNETHDPRLDDYLKEHNKPNQAGTTISAILPLIRTSKGSLE
ncbi:MULTISPECIES: MerR family transcriptional regulator [Enterococcus]|uniref:MerR family transcriptional regulator n=1 Tax=Enterococcus TaxID=1350 RepID=UPI00287F8AAF|nr:MerR family transcriptional regulator [Enterococcus faecium]